jgi:hypothetical protein
MLHKNIMNSIQFNSIEEFQAEKNLHLQFAVILSGFHSQEENMVWAKYRPGTVLIVKVMSIHSQ